MIVLAQVINLVAQAYIWIVIASVILSYFMDPFHPIRRGIDVLVQPLLEPIRRIMPSTGMFDFSPIVLVLVVQLGARLIIGILLSL